jgi:hypothetical protein
MPKAANYERDEARRYRRLIAEGKTTTPEQALAAVDLHRLRAEEYERSGNTQAVQEELGAAATYEDFAIRAGGITRQGARPRANEYRKRESEAGRLGHRQFADHYRAQALKLERLAESVPAADASE